MSIVASTIARLNAKIGSPLDRTAAGSRSEDGSSPMQTLLRRSAQSAASRSANVIAADLTTGARVSISYTRLSDTHPARLPTARDVLATRVHAGMTKAEETT